jgi:FlgD Ig-like domain
MISSQPRRPRRLVAASLAAALAGLPALPARALDVQVRFDDAGGEARILVQYVPATEPLGALRLHLRFKEGAGVGALTAMTVFAAPSGPWSQVMPELRRDGRVAEILALAPTVGGSRIAEAVTVAELALPLTGKGLATAEDLIDSVWVTESLLPFGGKTTLAHRLTTGIGKGDGQEARLAPRERVLGSQRILTFALARAGRVRVRVLDARGRTAVTVFDGRKGKGMQEIVWDGRGRSGRPLPGGTYFLRLEAGVFAYDRKLEVSP